MLEIARRKRDFAGVSERQLRLVHGDILDLDLGRTFDWVCLLFNTFLVFTSLEQQDQALQRIRADLKPRGRFWLDIFQPNLAILARQRTAGLEPALFYVPRYDRTVFKTIEVRPSPAKQLQRVIYQYLWMDKQGRQHRQKRVFDLTFILPRELVLLMERNGLRIEHLYGDYDGSELNDNSPRMVACCTIQ